MKYEIGASVVLLSFMSFWASAADVLFDGGSGVGVEAFIVRGELATGDSHRFRALLEESFQTSDWKMRDVYLDSPGGNLEEAMRIGRHIRERQLRVTVARQCLSSCVLMLAGGTERWVWGKIGVHRPYFAVVEPGTDIQHRYREMVQMLRAYFVEMNVPESLADLMMSTPPEEMRILDSEELAFYFPKEDPIFNEMQTAEGARIRGISSAEYRRRQIVAEAECESSTHGGFRIGSPESFQAMEDTSRCKQAITWGLSRDELEQRVKRGQETCPKEQPQRKECGQEILRE